MSTLLYLLLAILLLGILIAVHEGGHFLTARLTGIPVREYAIGMGPKLFSRTSKKTGIVFSLRAIPMGGFCAFYGEDDPDKSAQDDPRAFSRQAVWKRVLTVLMGPGSNFILALVVLILYTLIGGVTMPAPGTGYEPMIVEVTQGGPAEEAGIRSGDFIVAVNGESTAIHTSAEQEGAVFSRAITGWQEGDAPLTLTVRAGMDGEERQVTVSPRFDTTSGRMLIDVSYNYYAAKIERVHLGLWDSLKESWADFKFYATGIFDAVIGLFRGQNLDQVTGPVGTLSVISEQVKESGLDAFVRLLAIISVNLGIVNLLPIPGLDGSRIVFMVIEAIRGKPVPPEKEAIVHLVGMGLLVVLMVVLTVQDIGRLF